MNKVKYYASYLDINLDAIQHNCRICANKFRVPIMAVVKADAYGFGALPVAKLVLRRALNLLRSPEFKKESN